MEVFRLQSSGLHSTTEERYNTDRCIEVASPPSAYTDVSLGLRISGLGSDIKQKREGLDISRLHIP